MTPRLRQDHNAHVALEFEQRKGDSRYLYFSPSGLQVGKETTSAFERRFNRALDRPLGAAALRLLELNRSADTYLPDPGANAILVEIIIMTAANTATADLSTMTLDQLMVVYDGLRTVAKLNPVKKFKSKGEAIKRIEALRDELSKRTPPQEEHAAAKAEEAKVAAAKRATASEKLSKAADRVAPDKGKKSGVASAKKTVTKPKGRPETAAKRAAKKADGKPRGQGIGAFCMDLIKAGKSNEDVLAAVKKKFPDASTSAASVAWYRNKLKNEA